MPADRPALTRRDVVVALVVAAADALVFFSPTPAYDPAGWDPGLRAAIGVDVLWSALSVPWLLVRRSRPGTALAGVVVLSVVGSLLLTCRPTLTVCVALAAVAAQHRWRLAVPAAAAWAAWVVNEVRNGENGTSAGVWVLVALSYSALLVVSALFGHWQGRGRQRDADLAAAGARAVEAERARVARELHDVVAHSVTVMTIQSAGARAVMDRDAARAAEALRAVEATGVQAVEELRALLARLRRTGGHPGPSLDRLPELVESARASGREVVVRHLGHERTAHVEAQEAVFRLAQEGITNALKHAGPGPLELDVVWDAAGLAVAVTSPPPVHGQPLRVASTGNGLAGLRERLELLGGTLSAGPDPQGRWRLHGSVPLPTEVTS